jgi:voltage-gated potassium channel
MSVGSTRSGSDEWSQTVSGGRRDEVMSSRRVLNSRCMPSCYLRVTFGFDAAGEAFQPPRRTDDRSSWFVRNLHKLLIVALPFFRPLRLLRLVTLLSVLHRTLGDTLRGRVVTYVVGSAAMLVFVGALAVPDVEQSAPDAKIVTFGDALWWAITTITTVGYGDLYPVTPLGRIVAAALMMSGIAVLGVVTASIASWLVQRVEDTVEAVAEAEEPVRAEMAEMVAEIVLLRREIAELKDGQSR